MRRLLLILIVLASIGGAAYWYIFERETDWAQATLDDVSHIYQALHYGHPGSVDTTNPEFRQTLETAHLRALDRASTVTTAAGHFYTKRAFTVAFQDVHVGDLRNDIETRHSQIAAADAIVLDVRGNNGGATSAGQDVAAAIWGRAYVNDHRPTFEQTEWRASEFNLELVNGFADQIADAIGADAPLAQEVATIRDGIRSAVENGNSFFIQTQDQVVPTGTPSSVGPIPVILLTHGSCVSACLDFVDLVMAFDQSLHVGAETGGDTRYLEVVYSDLPSGTGRIAFPTAIHRGRDRGDNVTYVPSEDWSAEITNTPVLEARISQLGPVRLNAMLSGSAPICPDEQPVSLFQNVA
ncbi:S41 family peptidase [Maricaulaceae bacterium NA33B04]|nr:S41 family peptidase [Maricaulaceae bacterium NA33B04]